MMNPLRRPREFNAEENSGDLAEFGLCPPFERNRLVALLRYETKPAAKANGIHCAECSKLSRQTALSDLKSQ